MQSSISIRFKGCFPFIETLRRFHKILWNPTLFWKSLYIYQRMPMGLNISPSIWQSYINMILECLQSRKYCEVIMDDLLLFTPMKKAHISKLEDLLKALLKNRLKVSPKKCQLFKTGIAIYGQCYIYKG